MVNYGDNYMFWRYYSNGIRTHTISTPIRKIVHLYGVCTIFEGYL